MERLEKQPPPLDTVVLDKYGTDLTKAATENSTQGETDAATGLLQKQIDRAMQVLCKKKKNNAFLVGDSVHCRTLVAEGVAQRISKGTAPQNLLKKKVYSLDMERLYADIAYDGDFQDRLWNIVKEVKASNGAVILFIDEFHELIRAASGTLIPALVSGELKCIGATTLDEYRVFTVNDPVLGRIFSLVDVPEPTVEETVEILKGVRNKYEAFHGANYTDTALEDAARLSKLHMSDGFLPDKTINLIDEAGARTHLFSRSSPQTLVVTDDDIQEKVSDITGIPVEKVAKNDDDATRLLIMEEVFSRHIIGQDEAVSAVSRAIRRASVGIRNPNRPIASFLFVGPTGVGKTELAKLLATEYFGSKEAMVRLDMSEYVERHAVSKLFGSPPGYISHNEGGQLTEAVRHRPHNLILFDEIEKAHPDVYNAFLQILDDGRLTDSKGQTVDFKNTIIIMTSNVGGHLTETSRVAEELKKVFMPEFLNRIDEVIVFKRLGKSEMKVILEGMLEEVNERLKGKKIRLVVSENLQEKLLEEGYSPSYGARAMRRAITKLIEDKLAERILKGEVSEGDVFMDVDDIL